MGQPATRVSLRKSARKMGLVKFTGKVLWNDLRANYLGQIWPLKPETLNLLVNDICNSKCQMCLIWKRKQDKEITPGELESILKDPLFDKLSYVGVSGGEPTLRKDLPDIFKVLVDKKPKLKGVGIITNAIRPNDVISRIIDTFNICKKAGVRFNVMVSLDGVGEAHDRIRGREGNFESALEVIQYLRTKTEIPVIFGCTITKDNVWDVDELLDFARGQGLYGRFRVAEFIDRLYNDEQKEVIRNFTPLEAYHLGVFFTKLERQFESTRRFKSTYRNLRAMLMEGKDRTIKCPYQTKAVVLDSRGQLLYCSPKSPVLGSTINISAKKIYIDNIDERKKIISRDCDHCIHDYHALPTTRDLLRQVDTLLWKKRLHPPSRPMFRRGIHQKPNGKSSPAKVNHALIVGWYGTETAGDKAILGEILHQLKQRHTTKITIASLNPYLTNWTVKELGYPNVEVIPTYSGDLLSTASQAEETIMGGGPLMDLVALGPVLKAFTTAKKSGNHTRIAGCGIGPLQERRYIEAVKQIILLADKIELRDSASVEWCKKHTGREDASCSGDPSLGFVKRWGKAQTDPPSQDRTLNCYLREWPPEYRGDLSLEQFSRLKEQFEEQLGSWINTLCKQYSLTPRLLAMHHFVVGGDDREFNRRFANQFLSHLNPIVEIKPFTVQDILTSMWKASLCITMRFHSTVFAHALNVPLLAIDYTNGGKIRAFLDDQNDLDLVFSTGQIAKGQWRGIAPRSFADEHNTDQHI